MAEDDWFGPETATFGDRLAAAREQGGMTQKQLAKRLGVKSGTVQDWEQDLSEPRANRLSMLAGLLNVSVTWLMNGEGDGVNAPLDDAPLSSDIDDVLSEIRELKGQFADAADRLGRLELRLRMKLKGEEA
jgi:transcriptional regulator with XRE-family HTH domain